MWVDAGFIEEMRELKGDYQGMAPPDTIPEGFGPPSLKATRSWWWHGSPVFSPDLNEMYFARYMIDEQRTEIQFMKQVNGTWTKPEQPSFANTSYSENNPFFSPHGDTLYYYSEKPGGPYFYVVRQNDGWSTFHQLNVPIPANREAGRAFSIAKNGTIYLELWNGANLDIYSSYKVEGRYTTPQKLSSAINTDSLDRGTYIDPDERYLIFSSNRAGGYGPNDLYISYKNADGDWDPAKNMGATINTPEGVGTYHPMISPDGKYLFMVSWRGKDLGYNPYWVKLDSTLHPVGISEMPVVMNSLELFQNYPNPAYGQTTIEFFAETGAPVKLDLLDITGRVLNTLIDCPGSGTKNTVSVDLREMSPGLYFYKLTSGKSCITRQLMKLR